MRVRKVVTRSGKHFRGKFPSAKLNRMVHWESMLERDAILLFEYHPLVSSYQEQPSIEHYYDASGNLHRYFPDFRLDFIDGTELLVEVKPAEILATKEVRLKFEAVSKRFAEQRKRFRILTEVDIRRSPLFENLKRLHSNSKTAASTLTADDLLMSLPEGHIWAFREICDALGNAANVFKLIRANHLQVDMEAALTDTSAIWVRNHYQGKKHDSFRI